MDLINLRTFSSSFLNIFDNTRAMTTLKYLSLISAIIIYTGVFGAAQTTASHEKPKYDAKLAKKLGADEYGMKNYVFVILKTGLNDAAIKGKERDEIFKGHMANIGRLADEGKLAVAGPFGKNEKGFRGLFIFNVATVEEAQKLVETDPAVRSGILIADMTPWYGSASLMAMPEIHKKIAKVNP